MLWFIQLILKKIIRGVYLAWHSLQCFFNEGVDARQPSSVSRC
jgi:hypothetical protein